MRPCATVNQYTKDEALHNQLCSSTQLTWCFAKTCSQGWARTKEIFDERSPIYQLRQSPSGAAAEVACRLFRAGVTDLSDKEGFGSLPRLVGITAEVEIA